MRTIEFVFRNSTVPKKVRANRRNTVIEQMFMFVVMNTHFSRE